IREPRGSTKVITDVVEISEVKRSDKNTATSFLFLFCGKKENKQLLFEEIRRIYNF
ncbi:MAG: hypothetical protein RL728_946, partial [Bacteroidota bacterium]